MIVALYLQIQVPIVALSVSFLILFGLQFITLTIHTRWISGVLVSLAISLIGLVLMSNQLERIQVAEFHPSKEGFTLNILSEPIEKENSYQYDASIDYHPNSMLRGEKVLLYVNKAVDIFHANDAVSAYQYVNRIDAPKNPNGFDYQKFMDRKNIHFQTYLDEQHILDIEQGETSVGVIQVLRNHCKWFIENYINQEQQGIAKALLIGDKEDLNAETSNEFKRAGTMHILAVSGLHVGMIYLLLQFFFAFFQRKLKLPKHISLVCIILGIWLFALLTGAKASVIRAATMFMIFAIGRHFYPTTNSLNILAAVAFAMLCVKPIYLLDVGFQLSFSAVAGILLLIPIFQKIRSNNRLIDYFLGIAMMSVAAQLATLPFTVHYFHQFPILGIFSNLIAIPLAFGIVLTGFVGILLSFISPIAWLVGKVLSFLLSLMQWNNQFISDLNFSVIEQLYINSIQTILLCFAILFFILHIRGFIAIAQFGRPKFHRFYLFSSLLLFLLFFGSISWSKYQSSQKDSVIVYSLKDQYALEVRNGREVSIFSEFPLSDKEFNYNIKPHHLANHIQQVNSYLINDSIQTNHFMLKDSILLVDEFSFSFAKGFDTDYTLHNGISNRDLKQETSSTRIIANRYRPIYISGIKDDYFLNEGFIEID